MTWNTENIDALRNALRSELEGLDVQHLDFIGEGFRSIVAETDDHIILIGKHPGSAESFKKEYTLLPGIAKSLPCEVPRPDYFAESELFPYGVMGYPKICGVVLSMENIDEANLQNVSAEVAEFLVALHNLDTRPLGLNQPDYLEQDRQLRDHVLPTLERVMERREFNLIDRWWKEYLENEDNFRFDPAFGHGDLWYENLILSQNLQHIVGVIDFEACGLRDPASDFAPLNHLSLDFCREVSSIYAKQKGLDLVPFDKCIQRHWEKREFGGIRYSIKNGDQDELNDSIRKLRRGPILSGGLDRGL